MHDRAHTSAPRLRAVVLAAGLGRRLGSDRPKPLAEIAPGVTLLGNLVDALGPAVGRDRVTLVLGHGADAIRTAFPDLAFVINPRFAETNTAKSLELGLESLCLSDLEHGSESRATPTPVARASRPCENDSESGAIPEPREALWVNADLYVDHATVHRFIAASGLGTRALVNRQPVGAEEVKYALNDAGTIAAIGKHVDNASGEALGMNIVAAPDLPEFVAALHAAGDRDYFEGAMDRCIQAGTMRVAPFDAGGSFCREVDTPADLGAVREHLELQQRMKGGGS